MIGSLATNEIGKIEKMTYELMLKTLDYIEIDSDGKIDIVFLAGVKTKNCIK